jgi:hypothetical protein
LLARISPVPAPWVWVMTGSTVYDIIDTCAGPGDCLVLLNSANDTKSLVHLVLPLYLQTIFQLDLVSWRHFQA